MNELSGSRRHGPLPTASLSHGLQPPEPPPASRTGTGEGTNHDHILIQIPTCPEDPRHGAGLVPRYEGSVGRSRQGIQVGAAGGWAGVGIQALLGHRQAWVGGCRQGWVDAGRSAQMVRG